MAAPTLAEMHSHNRSWGGEAHAAWCTRFPSGTCDGRCTATATVTTRDGSTVVVTVTLPHGALWPILRYSLDGKPWLFDPSRLTLASFQQLNRQVRVWNDGNAIPDPSRRPVPPEPTTGGAL